MGVSFNKISAALAALTVSAAGFAHHESSFEHLPIETRVKMSEKTEDWSVEPKVVTAADNLPPSDAIVMFADNLDEWQSTKGGEAQWTLAGGVLTVAPGKGDIRTKRQFCDVQIHLEWRAPTGMEDKQGQQRNNAGIFLQERYELQILDSYSNRTYGNGQAGAIYKQQPPLVNATKPAGEWQRYDIIYTAPRFEGDKRVSKGAITALHNGVLIQNHHQIEGTTEWIGPPQVDAHGCAPIKLQDHGNLVSFRNFWIREL